MKSKKIHIRFMLSLIVFTSVLSIQFAKAQDSIKYSIEESKALLDAYLNLPNYINLYKQTEKQLEKSKQNEVATSKELSKCEEVKNISADLISEQEQSTNLLNKKIKRTETKCKIWKTLSMFFGATTSGILIYNKFTR